MERTLVNQVALTSERLLDDSIFSSAPLFWPCTCTVKDSTYFTIPIPPPRQGREHGNHPTRQDARAPDRESRDEPSNNLIKALSTIRRSTRLGNGKSTPRRTRLRFLASGAQLEQGPLREAKARTINFQKGKLTEAFRKARLGDDVINITAM